MTTLQQQVGATLLAWMLLQLVQICQAQSWNRQAKIVAAFAKTVAVCAWMQTWPARSTMSIFVMLTKSPCDASKCCAGDDVGQKSEYRSNTVPVEITNNIESDEQCALSSVLQTTLGNMKMDAHQTPSQAVGTLSAESSTQDTSMFGAPALEKCSISDHKHCDLTMKTRCHTAMKTCPDIPSVFLSDADMAPEKKIGDRISEGPCG
jgi:hypothetical protein